MNKYLIVVDVQKDFVDGALGTPEAQAIIPRVKEKIAEYRANGGTESLTKTYFRVCVLQSPKEHQKALC